MKNNKKILIEFLVILSITSIIFIPFLQGHYATDTYNIFNMGYKEYSIKLYLNDGRFILAALGLFAWKINLYIDVCVVVTAFLAIIISCIAVLKLKYIIQRYKEPQSMVQQIILIGICYITIFNFMYIENMYFIDSITMSTSILLYMISADILVKQGKNKLFNSMLFAILGVICYQGTIGMFVAFLILFTILKNKNRKKNIVFDLLGGVLVSSTAVLLNIFSVKIVGNILNMEQNRLGNIKNILNNIKVIIITLPDILQNTCNLFPKNAFLFFVTTLTIIVLIYQIKNMNQKNSIYYNYLTVFLITLMASNITYLLTLTSFYTGRLRTALGALIGIIFLLLYVETDLFEKKKLLNICTQTILLLYILITIINYERIMIEHRAINKLEQLEVNEIEEYIEQYEKVNNTNITKIINVIITDNYSMNNARNIHPILYNALKTNWADDGVINFYTKRNLQKSNMNQYEFENMRLDNKDKDYICNGDALYIKVFFY